MYPDVRDVINASSEEDVSQEDVSLYSISVPFKDRRFAPVPDDNPDSASPAKIGESEVCRSWFKVELPVRVNVYPPPLAVILFKDTLPPVTVSVLGVVPLVARVDSLRRKCQEKIFTNDQIVLFTQLGEQDLARGARICGAFQNNEHVAVQPLTYLISHGDDI